MMRAQIEDAEARLINEAAEWRMIGLLFECPSEDWRREIAGLAEEISDEELAAAGRLALSEGSEGLFHSTFGPGGPAPGREVSYRSWVQPGYMISEINAFYRAFAFSPKTPETPDHVAVEASFISYLKMKQAFAVASGRDEQAKITSEAEDAFVRGHLSKIAEPLCNSLALSGLRYLAAAGNALLTRTGPDPDRQTKRQFLPVLDTDEETFRCGNTS